MFGSYSPYSMMQNPFGMMGGGYSSNFGMLNSYMGLNYGMDNSMLNSLRQNYSNPNYWLNSSRQYTSSTTRVTKTNNADAGKVDADQDKTAGEAFDKAITDIATNGSAKLFDYTDEKDYKAKISELGKSYAAFIDQAGNKDGEVTEEEFRAKFLGDKNSAIEEQMAKLAFDKVDQNGDGKADWKELASMMAALDQNASNKLDGKMSKAEYENWLEKMILSTDTTFETNVQNKYKQLFGDDK